MALAYIGTQEELAVLRDAGQGLSYLYIVAFVDQQLLDIASKGSGYCLTG